MNIGNINGEAGKIRKLHEESGFDYKMPDINNPRFPIQRAISHDGKFIAASFVKVEAEVYLVMDHEVGTPEQRWEALKLLHADVVSRAKAIGFDQLYCVLPPEVAKSFGPRLEELGWQADRGWKRFTLELAQ